jgi:hypothetical protein
MAPPVWGAIMSFIQRELDLISAALGETPTANDYDSLYAAQQALAWALEPSGIKAPFAMIRGIQAVTADCSADPHPAQS